MTTRYYKAVASSAPAKSYEIIAQLNKEMVTACESFAELFNGVAVYATSADCRRFAGIRLTDFESRADKHLWTKPTKQNGYVSFVRSKAPSAAHKAEHEALQLRYSKNKPELTQVSFDSLYKDLGTDWGILLFVGISFFSHNGDLYISTKSRLQNCTEILASEYDAADKAYRAGGAV